LFTDLKPKLERREQERKQREIQGCTFTPSINRRWASPRQMDNNGPVEDRLIDEVRRRRRSSSVMEISKAMMGVIQ